MNTGVQLHSMRKVPHRKFGYRPWLELLESRTAPAFLPGVQYTTGVHPERTDVADFNQDGRLDVAVANCGNGKITVFLGKGDGTLAPKKEYPVHGSCPFSVETGDMNNDGIPDLQSANDISGDVSVLLGNGDGTFQKPIIGHLPHDVIDVVVRDYNTDGFQDAAAISYRENAVYILLGNGTGALQHVGTMKTAVEPIQMAADDFNNDGAFDIAVSNQYSDSFSVFLGNGDGTFMPKVDYPSGGDYANGISTADFDNDGNPDVVISNSRSNKIALFEGKGDGTFQAPVSFRVRRNPTGSTVNDFNGDGFVDIAVSSPGEGQNKGVVTVLLNNQSGGFVSYSVHPMPLTFSVASGDLNADGFSEIMATHGEPNRLTVLVNDGVWAPPVPIVRQVNQNRIELVLPGRGAIGVRGCSLISLRLQIVSGSFCGRISAVLQECAAMGRALETACLMIRRSVDETIPTSCKAAYHGDKSHVLAA